MNVDIAVVVRPASGGARTDLATRLPSRAGCGSSRASRHASVSMPSEATAATYCGLDSGRRLRRPDRCPPSRRRFQSKRSNRLVSGRRCSRRRTPTARALPRTVGESGRSDMGQLGGFRDRPQDGEPLVQGGSRTAVCGASRGDDERGHTCVGVRLQEVRDALAGPTRTASRRQVRDQLRRSHA